MQILINTDSHIESSEKLTRVIEDAVQQAIGRFGDRITLVEIYLSDENSKQKFGDSDKRCVIEARLGGLQPITVSHHGSSLEQALGGATDKLKKSLSRTLGRKDSLFKRRVREREEMKAAAPLLQHDAETGAKEDFIKVLRPLLGHLGQHARRELRIMEANGTLYPGQVLFADLLDEMVAQAWLKFADRPQWMAIDLWFTKLLNEITEAQANHDLRVQATQYSRTYEVQQQDAPQLEDKQWLDSLLGQDEAMSEDNAVPSRQHTWAELEAEELMCGIHSLLGDLPKTERQAFVLNVLEAYDLSEIAMLQCRPEIDIRADIESARTRLRERLGLCTAADLPVESRPLALSNSSGL